MGRRQRPSGEPLVEWPKPSHNWPSHRDLIERHVARVIVPPQALEVRLNPASACGSYGYRSRQSPALFVGRAGAENWAPFVAAAIIRAIDSRDAVLVRKYQGDRHTVTVVPNGYVWHETTYASL